MFENMILEGDAYNWVKALHVISVISWMAGLLYLPRLYAYHSQAQVGSHQSETFKIMERRLLRAIMTPAMVFTWVLGLWLYYSLGAWSEGWAHAKLSLVVLMTVFHMVLAKWRRNFAEDRNQRSEKFYRIANEVPTVLMIAIVIFVIVKPF